MNEVQSEWMGFLQAFVTGMIVYSAYHCIRKFRRIMPHQLVLISIEDAVFWIWVSVFVFVQIYHTSNGSIRWYFALGIVFGGAFLGILKMRIGKMTKKDKNE